MTDASHGENNQAGGPVDIVQDGGQVLRSGVYRLETKIYGGVQGCGGLIYNWVVTRGERGILDGGSVNCGVYSLVDLN